MASWTADDLRTIGEAEELEVSSLRADGSQRPYVTIWVVRVGDELYVRSISGRDRAWFHRALLRHEGRVRAAGLERDVTFEEPDHAIDDAVDAAYHAKYDSHGARVVGTVLNDAATAATFRLQPR